MPREGKIKTSIYLPLGLHWRFKEEVVKRRFTSDTAAMEEAIREWIERAPAGDAASAAAFAEKNGWHGMLAQILASGDPEAIRAMQEGMRALFRNVAGSAQLQARKKAQS